MVQDKKRQVNISMNSTDKKRMIDLAKELGISQSKLVNITIYLVMKSEILKDFIKEQCQRPCKETKKDDPTCIPESSFFSLERNLIKNKITFEQAYKIAKTPWLDLEDEY